MFEFKGTAADSPEGSGLEWRVVDHNAIQNLGKRPFTPMLQPALHQRPKTEGARRPLLQLRSRSNSSIPNYSRPQDRDDLSPGTMSLDRRMHPTSADRRSVSGGSTHARGDSLDSFAPKAWMAKGSRFLKRQNSKQELTSLRTQDWVEENKEARVHHVLDQPPPSDFRHSRMWSTGDSNAAPRPNISEPFDFHHVTHTQHHHAQQLEQVNPNDLVSEFFALRASQASQPELRGIKTKDIQREDLPPDALLPDSPSHPPNGPAGLPRLRPCRILDHAQDSPSGATSPWKIIQHPRPIDNFSQPGAAYHAAQKSPTSPPPQTLEHPLTPDFFTFQNELPSHRSSGSEISTESSESMDYPIGTWNNGLYDLGPPHAVTTDDGADWNRQVPFSMVKTELAPVEEGDENEEKRSSISPFPYRPFHPQYNFRYTKYLPSAEQHLRRGSDTCMPAAEHPRGGRAHLMRPADEGPNGGLSRLDPLEDVLHSLDRPCMPPAQISEPSVEDAVDDVLAQPHHARPISAGPNDMEEPWEDAVNDCYARGAESYSDFDWHRSSMHGDDMTAPTANNIQTDAADTSSEPAKLKFQLISAPASKIVARRSSSVYSSSPPPLLPLQTSPPKLDPPSAVSTESSFSSISEAITPNETSESAMATKFSIVDRKEWRQPAWIVPNDVEYQAISDDLDDDLYTGEYSEEPPLQLHTVGRIDGSTISNSPRSSRSPISKSSSQESFWYTQAACHARRPRNAGSVGSLPELMSSKNSRERVDPTLEQLTDKLTFLNPSGSLSDGPQTSTTQRRRSPNLAKDAAQNIMLSKVRTTEEPVPQRSASHDRANSDVTLPAQDPSMPPPLQPAAGRRMRSGSSASSVSARGSRGSYNLFPPQHTNHVRNP